MASKRTTVPQPTTAPLPLFYKEPQALMATVHGDLHLKAEQDFRFAARTNAVPIMAAEFVEAQHSYPIVFVGDPAHPATVLGLEADNLFVDAAGAWVADRYIPAYVRRYPFVFIESTDKSQYALGIDAASDRLTSNCNAGLGLQPLFSGGQPTQLTQDALRFSAALQSSQVATRAFCEALIEQDLLIDQQAHGALPSGKPFNVQGFRIIDAAKVQTLSDDVVLDWHRKGWLALVHFHLASLQRWRDLLACAPPAAADVKAEPAEA